MTQNKEALQLPRITPVKVGTITVCPHLFDVDNAKQLTEVIRDVNHVLSLLPEEDILNAEGDDNHWHFTTDNQAALEFAWKKDLLDECSTAVDVIVDLFAADNCDECVSDLIDQTLDSSFSVNLLSDGLYLVLNS